MIEPEEARRLGQGAPAAFAGRLAGDLSGVMVHRGPLAGLVARSASTETASSGAHLRTALVDSAASTASESVAQVVVQRALSDEMVPAVQRAALTAGDLDALVERVYQRLWDQLRLERERAAWLP